MSLRGPRMTMGRLKLAKDRNKSGSLKPVAQVCELGREPAWHHLHVRMEQHLLWAGLSHTLGICPEWWAAAGRLDSDGRAFRSFCSLWDPVVSRIQLWVLTPVSPLSSAVTARFWPVSLPCRRWTTVVKSWITVLAQTWGLSLLSVSSWPGQVWDGAFIHLVQVVPHADCQPVPQLPTMHCVHHPEHLSPGEAQADVSLCFMVKVGADVEVVCQVGLNDLLVDWGDSKLRIGELYHCCESKDTVLWSALCHTYCPSCSESKFPLALLSWCSEGSWLPLHEWIAQSPLCLPLFYIKRQKTKFIIVRGIRLIRFFFIFCRFKS